MLFTEHHCRPVVNLKSAPKILVNQQIYPSIAPGYHMNKKHWISVYAGEDITVSLLNDLINDSWNLVVDGLPKESNCACDRADAITVSAFSSLIFYR